MSYDGTSRGMMARKRSRREAEGDDHNYYSVSGGEPTLQPKWLYELDDVAPGTDLTPSKLCFTTPTSVSSDEETSGLLDDVYCRSFHCGEPLGLDRSFIPESSDQACSPEVLDRGESMESECCFISTSLATEGDALDGTSPGSYQCSQGIQFRGNFAQAEESSYVDDAQLDISFYLENWNQDTGSLTFDAAGNLFGDEGLQMLPNFETSVRGAEACDGERVDWFPDELECRSAPYSCNDDGDQEWLTKVVASLDGVATETLEMEGSSMLHLLQAEAGL
eukprot:c1174_g1_i1 orf=395-1228(+)